jgi:cell division protein FtsQ
MAVTAPEDRRFRRGRTAPAQRKRRKGPWDLVVRVASWGAAALAIGLVAWAASVGVAGLRVRGVVVQGNVHLSTGEVLSLLDGLIGQPMLRADLETWRGRLQRSPWVADAVLRRSLPDAVEVTLTERQPLAIGRLEGRLVLVDAGGVVIDEYGPRYEVFDLPIVDGLATPSGSPGTPLQGPRARLTARFLSDLSADRALLDRVSQVNVSDPSNLVLWLEGDDAKLLLGDRDFRNRLMSYLDLRPSLRARVSEMDYVDLRFGSRVFVRPAEGLALGGSHRPGAVAPRAPS